MAKIYFVECSNCKKKYYIDDIMLQREAEQVKMKCPYCKQFFFQDEREIKKEK